MMRVGRPGFALGMLLVLVAITTVTFLSGGWVGGGIPASGESVQLGLVIVAVFGIGVLATNYFTDSDSQSRFDANGSVDAEEALETLKRRYAAGDLDEIEFERKLEVLFETETVADAQRRVETRSVSDEQRPLEETDSEREERYPQRFERPPGGERPRSRRGHCK